MNKEKQIEEMVMLMTEGARPAVDDAEVLYNAGYRKASEVANDIFREIEKHSHITFINGDEDNPLLLVDYEFYNELKANIQREKENGL